jgi:hypothetical protein
MSVIEEISSAMISSDTGLASEKMLANLQMEDADL